MHTKKFFLFICLLPLVTGAIQPHQKVEAQLLCFLPQKINESSGAIYYRQLIWTFNDSGGEPEVYAVNPKTGEIIQTLVLINANNFDWEDITQDSIAIYIADTGNNFGFRKKFTIYRILKSEISHRKVQYVKAEKITFDYAKRNDYSFSRNKTRYDCEAIIAANDSLYLFTKNWDTHISEIYSIPARKGKFKAVPKSKLSIEMMITGADYRAKNDLTVLCGYISGKHYLLISSLTKLLDRKTEPSIYLISNFTVQNEAVAFGAEDTLFLTNEEGQSRAAIYSTTINFSNYAKHHRRAN
jgi:hypothetical protein